jgi:GNAT superfamily N-acetyltransferase/predicted nucleic acid-binding protein
VYNSSIKRGREFTVKETGAVRPRAKNIIVEIKQRPDDVMPFLKYIQSLADAGRDALGFLPVQVYEQYAKAGNLYIAVSGEKRTKFCGYVLFGDKFPHARIFQVAVVPTHRGAGIGKLLVNAVVEFVEEKGYLTICAKVANDLKANEFWQHLQFSTVRQKPGGATRNRLINVRLRDLNTPSLFGAPVKERVPHLPLEDRTSTRTAVYVIDLNVFFDVIRRRPRVEAAGRVFAAGFKNLVRVVVAEEFINELRRCSKPNTPDPVLELAMQLPTIPTPGEESVAVLIPELAAIVFPYRQSRLSVQDRSDLIHLATAIYHTAAGFVTSEKAIVEAGPCILSRYGVKVVDAEQFGQSVRQAENSATAMQARLGANHLKLVSLTPELRLSLDTLTGPLGLADAFVGPNQQSLIALLDEKAVAAIMWSCGDPLERVFSATIAADEDHPAVETALDAILYRFSQEATKGGPARLRLSIPRGQEITSQIAVEQGFSEEATGKDLHRVVERISFGGVVFPDKWQDFRSEIEKLSGNQFQEHPPVHTSSDASLEFKSNDGRKKEIRLSDLESTMSPICFIFPHRTSVMIPIQPKFAAELLGTSRQRSLLPGLVATLFPQRVYYSTPRSARLLSSGSIAVFYESEGDGGKGRKAAIAIARIISTTVVSKADVPDVQINHGVLDMAGVDRISAGTKIAVTLFDNVIEVPRPVPLKQLRSAGCVDRANLVCARSITAVQLATIAKWGWGT